MSIPPEIRDEVEQLFAPAPPAPPAPSAAPPAGAGASLIPPKTPSPPGPPGPPTIALTPEQADAVRVAVAAYRQRCVDLNHEHLAHAARWGDQVVTYDGVLRVIGPAKDPRP